MEITLGLLQDFVLSNEIELLATQERLCIPIINRIFRRMKAGIHFAGIKVENGVICDGHHRYVASLLAGKQLECLPGLITSATKIVAWSSIKFDEEDWDTEAKIKMLNEQDSAFNDIPLNEFLTLLQKP